VTDAETAVYVYGVVPSSDRTDIEAKGVGREDGDVRRVTQGGVAALVSDLPPGALVATRDLRAHWSVLEEAAARTTILPVRFGTVMDSDEAVKEDFLRPASERLAAVLAGLEGKVQLSIKGFYDEELLLRQIVQEKPAIARMRRRVQGLPEAASYYDRISLGELVAAEVDQCRARDADLVLRRLEPIAEAARAEPPTAKDGALDTAFLVRRDQVDAFSEAVQQVAGELGDRVRIRYVGPLPPYSFADDDANLAGAAWA
jgi:Gas vesicle synthesis protein GvpL/GvpF